MNSSITACFCEIRNPGSFKNWDDYDQFKQLLNTNQQFEIVPVTSRYANVGETENLYRCKTCGSVWRLIEPDPPFSGLWELTANG
jgi:hypothetical protein